MTRIPVRAALAALLLAATLAGCGTGTTPVARVADRTLTVDDFVRAARGLDATIPGPPEQAKAMLLRELVQRELVLHAAHVHGIDTTAAVRNRLRKIRERTLLQALYQELAPTDLGVTDGEARAFYEGRQQKADVQVVYNTDPVLVRHAAEDLARGMPFTAVATRYNVPNALPAGGELGSLSPGDLFPPLDEAIRTQKVGAVGGPFETSQGWFLLRVRSRTPNPQQPFEAVRASISETIRQRKVRQALTNGLVGLEQAYHLEATAAGAADLFRLLEPTRVAGVAHWNPTPAERRRALATWDGGVYTLGDAIDDLFDTDVRGPDPTSTPAIRAWIQGQALLRIALVEAHRRHLDEEPAFRDRMEDARWNLLAQGEVTQSVSAGPGPADEEIRAQWEQAKALYPRVSSAHVTWVGAPDTALVGRIARRAAPGVMLADAAREVAPGLMVHDETMSLPREEPQWGEFQNMVAQMPPGAWTAPIFTGNDWRIVQLLQKTQSTLEWDQLTPAQKEQFTRGVGDRIRQRRYGAYMDSLWNANRPVLMPENLKRVPWPLPGSLAASL